MARSEQSCSGSSPGLLHDMVRATMHVLRARLHVCKPLHEPDNLWLQSCALLLDSISEEMAAFLRPAHGLRTASFDLQLGLSKRLLHAGKKQRCWGSCFFFFFFFFFLSSEATQAFAHVHTHTHMQHESISHTYPPAQFIPQRHDKHCA